MTGEEIERAIGFLLESQAKHDAQIGELRDEIAGLTASITEVNGVIRMQSESQSQFNETITQAVTALIEAQRRSDARHDATDARHDEIDARHDATDARIDRMVEAAERAEARHARHHEEMDARLDRLVSVVERLVEQRG
jgi:chromosome segregation ATPase